MPVVIVAETLGGGVRSLVESQLVDGESISGNVREFPNATQVPAVAAQLPPAFGIAPFQSAIDSAAVTVQTDAEITQPLILVTNGDPSAEVMAVIEASRQLGS